MEMRLSASLCDLCTGLTFGLPSKAEILTYAFSEMHVIITYYHCKATLEQPTLLKALYI